MYGVGQIIFGHTSTTVLHSSTKINDTIRWDNVLEQWSPTDGL
jgi:hypothetical protein